MEHNLSIEQKGLLKTFKFLVGFLEKHNLRYCAAAGTVLGAVRHKGFIPWHDDIDIMMPRDDYDKLMLMGREIENFGYELHSINNEGYYLAYAKVCDNNSTLWEVEELPYVIGNFFIDIFPLDFTDASDDAILCKLNECKKISHLWKSSIGCYYIKDVLSSICRCELREAKRLIVVYTRSLRKMHYRKKILRTIDINKSSTGNKCIWVFSDNSYIYKKSIVYDTIKLPFEDILIKIPKEYDYYLRLLYGDYMTLPPIEKRISHHFHYYVDLNRRLTIDDIKRIKTNGK